jgi:hypothetical protein
VKITGRAELVYNARMRTLSTLGGQVLARDITLSKAAHAFENITIHYTRS